MATVGICALRMALLASLALFLAPAPALALALGTPSQPFTISVDPTAPHAHGTVTFTPIPGDIDISGAAMTVAVNGKEIIHSNAGPFSLRVGGAGETNTVTITIKTNAGSYKQVVVVTPQDVVLVAEPLSSAPPLYPGKPLVPVGGSVRMVAIADLRTPKGAQIDPATLSYDWNIDGSEVGSASGIGKRSVIVASPLQYRSSTVSVAVTSPDGTLVASDSMDLVPEEPSMRLYERDPLMGIRFEKALTNAFALTGKEATFYAAPFSFPTAFGAAGLTWYVSGTAAQKGSLITVRPTGTSAGTATLSVTGTPGGPASVDALSTSATLLVSYGSRGGSSIFGL